MTLQEIREAREKRIRDAAYAKYDERNEHWGLLQESADTPEFVLRLRDLKRRENGNGSTPLEFHGLLS